MQTRYSDHARAKYHDMIAGPLNWNSILGTVIRAKIANPFFHQLQSLGIDQRIPTAVRRQFEIYYYKIGYQNIHILEQLVQLIRLLAEVRVDVIVLKGSALLAEVWPNPSLREMADIDILVRCGDLSAAEQSLQKNGYLPIEHHHPAEHYRKYHHHLVPYFNPTAACRLPIEIHHNIEQPTDPISVDMSDFWNSARAITFNDTTLHVLSPENLLVHLCMSLAYSNRFLNQIRDMIDISQTVFHFGTAMQWDNIVMVARKSAMANCIYYALYFSKNLFGAAIPRQVLDQIGTQVSVKFISHHLLRYLVKQYSLVSVTTTPLVPINKLKLVCRDIIADAGMVEKIKTFWYHFLFPERVAASGEQFGSCRRLAFIVLQLFKNLFSRYSC
jgi:hypothetical protein